MCVGLLLVFHAREQMCDNQSGIFRQSLLVFMIFFVSLYVYVVYVKLYKAHILSVLTDIFTVFLFRRLKKEQVEKSSCGKAQSSVVQSVES